MGTYSPTGFRSVVVDYVGNGANDRVVSIGFRPKFYAIFQRVDNNRNVADLEGFDSDTWSFFLDGGNPYKINTRVTTDLGVNVGLIWFWQGGANAAGVNYRIIAYS